VSTRLAGAAFLVGAVLAGQASAQTAGSVFRDCAECPEMVVVPAGSFQMGGAGGDEQPAHAVTLPAFAIGTTEVTQAEWERVMGANPSRFKDLTHPVEQVSAEDIQVFLEKLNATTRRQYRLPSEAEWEYAARAGGAGDYGWGGDPAAAAEHAWFADNAAASTHPVGMRAANAFGLHDMHGNVSEWVADCYAKTYEDAPADGSARSGNASCMRLSRGGSWEATADGLRSAARQWQFPNERNGGLRFPLARSLP